MKAFILTQKDFDKLLAELDRDPRWGETGGSSVVLSEEERKAHEDAHRRFNHRIHRWIQEVQS